MKSVFQGIFVKIIFMVLLLILPVHALEDNLGIIIVIDGGKNEMLVLGETVRQVTMKIREANSDLVPGRHPLVKFYDISDPKHKLFIEKRMNITRSKLPVIALGHLDRRGSFLRFDDRSFLTNVTDGNSASETVMKSFTHYLQKRTREQYRWKLNTGFKSIMTDPPGAEIFIDGHSVGKTTAPLKNVFLEAGEHTLKIVLPDYYTVEESFLFEYGSFPEVTRKLDWHIGSLRVITTPGEAQVFVNDEPIGESPASIPTLKSGPHVVIAKLLGYHTKIENTFVKGNKDGNSVTEHRMLLHRFAMRYNLTLDITPHSHTNNQGTRTLSPDTAEVEREIEKLMKRSPMFFERAEAGKPANIDITVSTRIEDRFVKCKVTVKDSPTSSTIYERTLQSPAPDWNRSNAAVIWQTEFLNQFDESLHGRQTEQNRRFNRFDSKITLGEDTVIRGLYQKYDRL